MDQVLPVNEMLCRWENRWTNNHYSSMDQWFQIVFRQKFADFMESVLIAFRSMVDHLSWMSIKSKEGAYSKIDDLTKNVAYPDFITDDKLLTQYYAALDIEVDDSYITMREKLFKFNQRTLLEQLSAGPAKRDDFSGSPGTVNAWYQVCCCFH